MNRYFRVIFVCVAMAVVLMTTASQAQPIAPREVKLLWPEGAPGAKGTADGDKPSITIHVPARDKANGAAVVIFPGGGYGHLAMDHEGHQIAEWLNSFGVAGFIVKYRHRRSGAGYGHPAPLQDAQRAIRTVRSSAKEWNIDPERIGIIGFSAGGHLASSLGTHFKNRYSEARDQIDRVSCRPDFMILMYPVISFTEPFTHKGSRKNLLGANPDPELVENLSNEKQVTPETPPTFIVFGDDDKVVPVENGVAFFMGLKKAKVPAEMHIYEKGRHGFGLGAGMGPVSSWPLRCSEWMQARGLLDK
ncbi:MAG: alpha/beta hydrolase [Planctomycetota bacterium]